MNSGKMKPKTQKASKMFAVESLTVISQVLQLEKGLILDVFYRYGSYSNFYNGYNKEGNMLNHETKMGDTLDRNALNQKTQMSNALDQETKTRRRYQPKNIK